MNRTARYAGILLLSALLTAGCGQKERDGYRQSGIDALNAGNYEEALTAFDSAIKASDGRVGKFELDVLKYRGEAEYRLEDYKAAAHTFDTLIQVEGEKPEYLNMRAMSSAALGQWEKALEDYSRAGELNPAAPGRANALLAVGKSMEEHGQTDQAMSLYQQAALDQNAGAELYNRMALCRMKEKEWDEALQYIQTGIEMGEEAWMPKLRYNEAVVYEYQGDFKKALELMESYAKEYGPDDAAEHEIAFLKTR